MRKIIQLLSILLCFVLLFEPRQYVGAQIASQLDLSSHLKAFHNTLSLDKYRPLHLRYLSYNSQSNDFKLLLDKGDYLKSYQSPDEKRLVTGDLVTEDILEETKKLMEYFFIGLSLPNESVWVNLRPDSQDNIIDRELAKTDIGKILLEADVQLKKDTALYTSPQTSEGKKYWDKLYKKAEELFGYDNITIPTLTRPWIVPGEIIIRETPDNAYIYKATLKVMLEEDYLSGNKENPLILFPLPEWERVGVRGNNDPRMKELNTYSTQLIKELIIPKITKEVNTSRKYAKLRQVYYSLILAQWFKARVSLRGLRAERSRPKPRHSVGASPSARDDTTYIQLINSGNLSGLTSKTPWTKDTYYQQYHESFKDGEYSLKEQVRTPFGQTIRSYFSGGMIFDTKAMSSAITLRIAPANQDRDIAKVLVSSGIDNHNFRAVLTHSQLSIVDEIKGNKGFQEGDKFSVVSSAVKSGNYQNKDIAAEWEEKIKSYLQEIDETEAIMADVRNKIGEYKNIDDLNELLDKSLTLIPYPESLIKKAEETKEIDWQLFKLKEQLIGDREGFELEMARQKEKGKAILQRLFRKEAIAKQMEILERQIVEIAKLLQTVQSMSKRNCEFKQIGIKRCEDDIRVFVDCDIARKFEKQYDDLINSSQAPESRIKRWRMLEEGLIRYEKVWAKFTAVLGLDAHDPLNFRVRNKHKEYLIENIFATKRQQMLKFLSNNTSYDSFYNDDSYSVIQKLLRENGVANGVYTFVQNTQIANILAGRIERSADIRALRLMERNSRVLRRFGEPLPAIKISAGIWENKALEHDDVVFLASLIGESAIQIEVFIENFENFLLSVQQENAGNIRFVSNILAPILKQIAYRDYGLTSAGLFRVLSRPELGDIGRIIIANQLFSLSKTDREKAKVMGALMCQHSVFKQITFLAQEPSRRKMIPSDIEFVSLVQKLVREEEFITGLSAAERKGFRDLLEDRYRHWPKGGISYIVSMISLFKTKELSLEPTEIARLKLYNSCFSYFSKKIYKKFRACPVGKEEEFAQEIQSSCEGILNGLPYSQVKQDLEKVDASIDEQFIFDLLMIVSPNFRAGITDEALIGNLSYGVRHENQWRKHVEEFIATLDRKRAVNYPQMKIEGNRVIFTYNLPIIQKGLEPGERLEHTKSIELLDSLSKGGQEKELVEILMPQEKETVEQYITRIKQDYLQWLGGSGYVKQRVEQIRQAFKQNNELLAMDLLTTLIGDGFKEVLRQSPQANPQEFNQLLSRLGKFLGIPVDKTDNRNADIARECYSRKRRLVGRLSKGRATQLEQIDGSERIQAERELYEAAYDMVSRYIIASDGDTAKARWRDIIEEVQKNDTESAQILEEVIEKGNVQYPVEIEQGGSVSLQERVFGSLHQKLFSDVMEEIKDNQDKFSERVVEMDTLEYEITKTAWQAVYGATADICIWNDLHLLDHAGFIPVAMKANKQFVGYVNMHVINTGKQRVILLAGINPTDQYLSMHNTRRVFDTIISTFEILAEISGSGAMGITTNNMAITNRNSIKELVIQQNRDTDKLGFEYSVGGPYKANEYFIVWEKDVKPINPQILDKILSALPEELQPIIDIRALYHRDRIAENDTRKYLTNNPQNIAYLQQVYRGVALHIPHERAKIAVADAAAVIFQYGKPLSRMTVDLRDESPDGGIIEIAYEGGINIDPIKRESQVLLMANPAGSSPVVSSAVEKADKTENDERDAESKLKDRVIEKFKEVFFKENEPVSRQQEIKIMSDIGLRETYTLLKLISLMNKCNLLENYGCKDEILKNVFNAANEDKAADIFNEFISNLAQNGKGQYYLPEGVELVLLHMFRNIYGRDLIEMLKKLNKHPDACHLIISAAQANLHNRLKGDEVIMSLLRADDWDSKIEKYNLLDEFRDSSISKLSWALAEGCIPEKFLVENQEYEVVRGINNADERLGATAIVFWLRRIRDNQDFILKVAPVDGITMDNSEFSDTVFKTENEVLKKLENAEKGKNRYHVPRVIAYGQKTDESNPFFRPYIIMELARGINIDPNRRWNDKQGFSEAEIVEIIKQYMEVLHTAHSAGIAYIDRKLCDLFWDRDDNKLMVIDWNVVQICKDNKLMTDYAFYDVFAGINFMYRLLTGDFMSFETETINNKRQRLIVSVPEARKAGYLTRLQNRSDKIQTFFRGVFNDNLPSWRIQNMSAAELTEGYLFKLRELSDSYVPPQRNVATIPVDAKQPHMVPGAVLDVQGSDKGGIDFRGPMPIVTQSSPIINLQDNFRAEGTSEIAPSRRNVGARNDSDNEWLQIEKMVNAGITPSIERVREYLASSCLKGDFNQDMDKVFCCFADILRLEEENSGTVDLSPWRKILTLIESDKPVSELQIAFNAIIIDTR